MADYVDPTTGSYGTIRLLNKDTLQQVASYPVDEERTTFGRDTKCSVRLYFHDVDPLHCTLYFDDGKAYLNVSGDSGVIVDGNHVTAGSTVCLNNGSHFMIWRKLFQFTPPPREVRARLLATPRPKARKALRMSMVNSALILTPQRTSPTLDLRTLQSPIRPFKHNPTEVIKFVHSDQVAVVEDVAIQTSPFDNEEDLRSLVALEEVEIEEEPPAPVSPAPSSTPYQFGKSRYSMSSPARPSSLSNYAEASSHRRLSLYQSPVRGVPSPQRGSPYTGLSARTPGPPRTPRRRSKGMSMHKAVLMRSAHRAHVAAEKAREEVDEEGEVEDVVSPERVTKPLQWETQNGDLDAEGEDYDDDDMEEDEEILDDGPQIPALDLTQAEAPISTPETADTGPETPSEQITEETDDSVLTEFQEESNYTSEDPSTDATNLEPSPEDAGLKQTVTPPREARGRRRHLGSFYTPQAKKPVRTTLSSQPRHARRTRASVGSTPSSDWRSGGGRFGRAVRPSLIPAEEIMEEEEESDGDENDQENQRQSSSPNKDEQRLEKELRAKRRQSALAAIEASPRTLPNPSSRRSSIFTSPTKRTAAPLLGLPLPSPVKSAPITSNVDEPVPQDTSMITDDAEDSDTESEPETVDDLRKNVERMKRESMARASRLSLGAQSNKATTPESEESESNQVEEDAGDSGTTGNLSRDDMEVEVTQTFTDTVQPLNTSEEADSSMESRLSVDRSLGPFDDGSESEEETAEPMVQDQEEEQQMEDVGPVTTSEVEAPPSQAPVPATPRMDGLRNLFAPPAEPAPTPSFVGMRDIFKNQQQPPATPSFDGMHDMFAEPIVENVEETAHQSRPETPVEQTDAASGVESKRVVSKIPTKRGPPTRSGKSTSVAAPPPTEESSSASLVKRSTRRKQTTEEEAPITESAPSTRGRARSATPATGPAGSTRSRRTPVAEDPPAAEESTKPVSPSKRSARSKVTPRLEPTVEEPTASEEQSEAQTEAVEERRRAPSRIARAIMLAQTTAKASGRRTVAATKEKESVNNEANPPEPTTASARSRNAKGTASSTTTASKTQSSQSEAGARVKRSTRARTWDEDDEEAIVESMPRKRLRSASVKVEEDETPQHTVAKKSAATTSRIATRRGASSAPGTRRTVSVDHDKENTPEHSGQESSSSKSFTKTRQTPATASTVKSASTTKKASTKTTENTSSSSRSLRSRTR
ncbi:hypothetical protein FRC02_005254 [Tulasnella sp. 418]|nr:hypothetical protein FRC02_005254 [Tulasnella sp. 418]